MSVLDAASFTDEIYKRLLETLSKERRERAERYRARGDKYLSAAAGYLLACALERAGLAADAAVFYGERGKPYIEGLNFNLSHSGTIAALAVASGEVGVDIQKIIPVKEGLMTRVCTQREIARLQACSGEEREREFFRLWTAKESAGKYSGRGIFDPEQFEIDLASKRVTRRGEALKATLKEYALDGYALTACADESFCKELVFVEFKE